MLEAFCAKTSLEICLESLGCKSFQSIFSLLARSLFAEKEKGSGGGWGTEEHRLSRSVQVENTCSYMISDPGTDFERPVRQRHGQYASPGTE